MSAVKSHTRQHIVRIATSLAEQFERGYAIVRGMTFRQVLRMVETMGYQAPWVVYTESDLNVVL